jgi:hypothetical protein
MTAVADGPVILVYAIFSLAAGLAIILGHNVWSGGTLLVIVTGARRRRVSIEVLCGRGE